MFTTPDVFVTVTSVNGKRWHDEPFLGSMALLRVFSALIELTAAYLMVRYNRVDIALRINGLLGLAGPFILVLVTLVGLAGISDKLAPGKLLLVASGVALILLGTR